MCSGADGNPRAAYCSTHDRAGTHNRAGSYRCSISDDGSTHQSS